MEIVRSTLTVFFEDPFWVGVYECQTDRSYEVMKMTFGTMPEDNTVLSLVLSSHRLSWHLEKTACAELKKAYVNPKRKQKQAVLDMQRHGAGTKAQQALSRQRDLQHQKAKIRTKENREAKKAYQYAQKIKKRKEKHRGH